MVKLHKHNAETYQKIISMFTENDRVCAVQPTGTGKSFLILKRAMLLLKTVHS